MNTETSNARGEWVLLPRVPTEAMIDAWRDAPNRWVEAYAAMLAAAPQPPSDPVGVEAIREAFDEISGLSRHLRQGGPAPEDLQDLSDALDEAVGIAANMLHALAQQPAAPTWIGIDWAAGQKPAAVDGACAVAAIQFAITDPEGMTFLRLWNEGEFDTLRREWPDAPSEVYVGADPLATQHQETTT